MNYDKLVQLLKKHLGQYKKKQQQYRFYCPFCNHYKRKLYINIVSQKWHCWVCGKSGLKIGSLIKKISNNKNDIDQYRRLRSQKRFTYTNNYSLHNISEQNDIELPPEYISLSYKKQNILLQRPKNYLLNRNITQQHIQLFNIGYCSEGQYKDRIIIPSYDNQNNLNYFIARSINPNSNLKYLNPVKSKNIIPLQSTINWNLPVILVQGMFDAITIKYNVIPLLGKTIQQNNSKLITTLLRRKSKVIVFLDTDARREVFKICQTLYNHGILNVYYVDFNDKSNKDANQLGFYNSWQLINNAKKYQPINNLKDTIRSKFGGISGKKNNTSFRFTHSII